MTDKSQSDILFERACRVIPGGVNSPVRAFRGVGGTPIFIREASGSTITDVDGKTYLDFVGSWGPMILGHAAPQILEALHATIERGTSFGAPTENEIKLAEKICACVPSIEQVRLVNSGTEAAMSAIRLARGFTGRDKILKFSGCYHGHVDALLVAAGSGALTLGTPDSRGVTQGAAGDTLVAPYNDLEAVTQIFERFGGEIAAVIVEPVAGNMGCVAPDPDFLAGLREITRRFESLLIFDEVMTGFRLALGGAQARFGVRPDLTCLGKILGGGLPIGAFGGSQKIMAQLAPLGPVYQAGTLSGNPLAVAAGLAMLSALEAPGIYDELERKSLLLTTRMRQALQKNHFPLTFNAIGSMFCLYFHPGPIENFVQVQKSDTQKYARYFHLMLEAGIYLAPSAFESGFVSLAHTPEDLEEMVGQTITALQKIYR